MTPLQQFQKEQDERFDNEFTKWAGRYGTNVYLTASVVEIKAFMLARDTALIAEVKWRLREEIEREAEFCIFCGRPENQFDESCEEGMHDKFSSNWAVRRFLEAVLALLNS